MADTIFQKRHAQGWIRNVWLPDKYGVHFSERNVRLSSGGFFKFDAVDDEGLIVGCISTSRCRTKGDNYGTGKMHKLRSDMLYLCEAAGAQRRIMVLTESDMLEACLAQRRLGRVPTSIEFVHAPLPAELKQALDGRRDVPAVEVFLAQAKLALA